jgi:hypothetical protein
MARAVDVEKKIKVAGLMEGDVVKLTNGEVATFIRIKQTRFLGTINGNVFNIPINMFVDVISKAPIEDIIKKANEKSTVKSNVLDSLKEGDWFYIVQRGNALAFKFVRVQGTSVIAKNPINNAEVKIGIGFEFGIID